MATAELAVLEGIMAKMNGTASQGKSSRGSLEWLADMRAAMKDMEAGLGKNNRDQDKDYHRMKVSTILLAKTLENCPDVARSCGIREQFSHLLHLVPHLDFNTLFTATLQLNLLPEFTELLLATGFELRMFIMENMERWILDDGNDVGKSQSLSLIDKLVFIVSLCSIATMIGDTSQKREFSTIAIKISKQFLKNLAEAPLMQTIDSQPKHYYEPLTKRILSMIKQRKKSDPSLLENLDVLQLTDVSHMLRGDVIANVCGTNTSKMESSLLAKLPKINSDSSFGTENAHSLYEAMKEVLETADECLHMLQGYGGFSGAGRQLQTVLAAFEQLAQREGMLPPPRKSHAPSQAITHHLKGFSEIALSVINDIGDKPVQENRSEILAAFQKNPECLSRSVHMLAILKAISRCQARTDYSTETAEVVSSLQELFWLSFKLLLSKPTMELVHKIVADRKLLSAVSQQPSPKNPTMLQTTFSSLLSEKAATDTVLSRMCELILRWPEGTIQKIIDQIFKSHHQAVLFVDILKKFEYLLTFKADSNRSSVIAHCFHNNLLSCWQNGETESIEHGLDFLSLLLSSDNMISSEFLRTFLKDVFFTSVVSSTSRNENGTSTRHSEHQVLPELLGLKVLSCTMSTPSFVECIGLLELMAFCVCLGARVDTSCHFWDSNHDFDLETHELLIECMEYAVTKIASALSELKKTGGASVEWFVHAISAFRWTTQLRFIPVIKLADEAKVSVPASLAEVCQVPDILTCSERLSYGAGTGLVSWHQCFVVNPSLCPLSSLDIDDLSHEATAIFSHGWTITLAQVLPLCLPHEWNTLLEATKVLVSDHKLNFSYDTMFVNLLPVVDMHDCYVVLGVAKILHHVAGILTKPCCVHWTSLKMWLYFSKRYCAAIARLINDSSEFNEAEPGSKFFMLSQTFCMSCDYMILLATLPVKKQHKNSSESLLVLLLDLVGTYEKIWTAITAEEDQDDDVESDQTPEEHGPSSFGDASFGSKSILAKESARTISRLSLEVSEQLRLMLHTITHLPVQEHRGVLKSKLSKLLEMVNEC